MKLRTFLFILMGLFHLHGVGQEIDSDKSIVEFAVRNMHLRTVRGTFSGMKGILSLDTLALGSAQIRVCIDAASINTANEKRDEHLRNDDFLAVDHFPSICFTASSIEFVSENQILAKGKLTLHGITREIEIRLRKVENAWKGTFQVNRFDYEIGLKYGPFMIGEVISLEVTCLLK